MKRLLCGVLLLTVLLCGCSTAKVKTRTPTPPQITTPQDTAAVLTIPASELLPGGLRVQTDYSAYRPQTRPQQQYTRLSDAFIADLQPSPDYGMLCPFVGSWLYACGEDGYDYQGGMRYGMADADGRIVVDAVYAGIYPLSVTHYGEETYLPIWVFSKTPEGDFDEEDFVSYSYGFATLDGSFVSDCIYSYIALQDECILAKQETNYTEGEYYRYRTAFTLFAADGTVLCDSAAFPFADRICDAYYGEDILSVGLTTDMLDEWGSEITEYYYVDLDGNILSGPYSYAQAFSDGYGLVTRDNASFFVDRNGNPLDDIGYYSAEPFHNGVCSAIAMDESEGYLLNTQGQRLVTVPASGGESNYLSAYRDGSYYVFSRADDCLYYGTDGTPVELPDTANRWYPLSGTPFFYSWNGDGMQTIHNPATHEELYFFENSYTGNMSGGTRCAFSIVTYSEIGNTTNVICYDSDFQELLSMDSGFIEEVFDIHSGEHYLLARTAGAVTLYDAQLQPLCTLPYSETDFVQLCGDRLVCTDAFGCAQYDLQGNLLFYYPLLTSAED